MLCLSSSYKRKESLFSLWVSLSTCSLDLISICFLKDLTPAVFPFLSYIIIFSFSTVHWHADMLFYPLCPLPATTPSLSSSSLQNLSKVVIIHHLHFLTAHSLVSACFPAIEPVLNHQWPISCQGSLWIFCSFTWYLSSIWYNVYFPSLLKHFFLPSLGEPCF